MPGARLRRPNDALSKSRLRAPEGAWIGRSTPRTRDGNFDDIADLTTSVYAAQAKLTAGVQRASLRAAVRSLCRSRARGKLGARKSIPTRCSRAERIELDEDLSRSLD